MTGWFNKVPPSLEKKQNENRFGLRWIKRALCTDLVIIAMGYGVCTLKKHVTIHRNN